MLKGTIYIAFARIVFIGSSYLIHIIAARYIGVTNYGVMGLMISLMMIIRLFFNYGIPQSVSYYISNASNEKEENEIFKTGTLITLIGSVIISIIYYLNSRNLAIFLKDESLTQFIEVSAFIIPSMALFQVFQGYLNGKLQFKKQSFGIIVYTLSRLILFVILLILGYEVMGIVLSFVLASYIAMIFSKTKTPNPIGYKKFSTSTILKSAAPILMSSVGLVMILNIDLLLVKRIDTNILSLGYYTAAGTLAKIPYMLLTSFAITFFSTVASMKSDPMKIKVVIESGMKQLFIILIPFVILISGFSSDIIKVIYGEDYLPASSSTSILVLGLGALCVYTSVMNIFNATSPKYAVFFSTFGFVFQLIICYILITKYSILGAAIGTTIASWALMILGIIFLKVKFKASLGLVIYLKFIIIGVTMSLIEYLFVKNINTNSYFRLLIGMTFAISVYVFMILIMNIVKKQEIKSLLEKFNPIKLL